MKTNRQIYLDQTVIKWMALLLNSMVKLAGKLFPKNHDLSRPFQTIAVCKFRGLGSIVQATPLLQTLRRQYPDATILFVTTPANKQMLGKIPLVDEVVLLNDKTIGSLLRGIFPFVWTLFRKKIDLYIDLEVYSNFSSVITALTNAQNRFGYYLKESNYRMGIYTHMMYYNSAVPISEVYMQWSRLLQVREEIQDLYEFETSAAAFPKADGLTATDRYLVINPNASDLRIERRWPAEGFVQLIQLLLQQYPQCRILLVGAPNERDYVTTIYDQVVHERVLNMAGRTSMEELICLLKHAAVVITNDTGPMHLAFAVKAPTVALFGPCSPRQYGINANAAIVYKNVYCSPCVHEFRIPPCLGNNQCMKQITVPEVLTQVNAMLDGHVPVNAFNDPRSYSGEEEGKPIALGMIRRKTY
jgi:ADP-heptose:LPS heptosyltransferase